MELAVAEALVSAPGMARVWHGYSASLAVCHILLIHNFWPVFNMSM